MTEHITLKGGIDLTLLEHVVLQAFGAKRESFQRAIELSFCNAESKGKRVLRYPKKGGKFLSRLYIKSGRIKTPGHRNPRRLFSMLF